ncbi:hypothetical protein SK128_009457 [Halocaridina rubra]|uniref:Ig-like domain-containing protein n=1 Tax=Halocaridina rubra TaxID=373956 RepID=A0AAN8WTA0_HALRR
MTERFANPDHLTALFFRSRGYDRGIYTSLQFNCIFLGLVDTTEGFAHPENLIALFFQVLWIRQRNLHILTIYLLFFQVSWIRQRDLHILTVGRYTYTSDDRYQVIHSRHSPDWILKIKYAQERDSGTYECQVSTKPIMSYVVQLHVFKAPKATIIGSPDMYVDEGSTINLTCIITHTPRPPQYIIWKHNGVEISYDSPRGGITMVTERGNSTTGYLLMKGARQADTGNYTCSPSNTHPSELRLHVLDGELPAAMQTNSTARPSISSAVTGILLIVWFLLSGIFIEEGRSLSGTWKDDRCGWEF